MSSDEGDQSHYTRIKQRVNKKIDHVKGDVLQVTFVKTLSVKDFKREILSFHSSQRSTVYLKLPLTLLQEIQEELEEHDNHVQDAKNLALGIYLLPVP